MPAAFLTPRSKTPATLAFEAEQSAMAPVNQQAQEQDVIQQQVDSEKAFQSQQKEQASIANTQMRQQEALQRKQETAQRSQVSRAKKAGVVTKPDTSGIEQIQTHEDGAPIFEHGFQGEPKADPSGNHVVDYRDPRGQIYKVPTKGIRSATDEVGAPTYEFDIPKADGTKETVRQPVGSKPLFAVDPKTGMRYTGAADPNTGSVGQTPIGLDPVAASKAALEKQKEAFTLQQQDRKFQSDETGLIQAQKETNLAPLKKSLSEAQAAAKKLAKEDVRYRQDPEKGYIPIAKVGNTDIEGAPITNVQDISKAQAWLDKKAATDKSVLDAKAAHDPLASEVFTLQQKRDKLALDALAASHNAQVQLADMERAHKAGIPVHEPDWQKKAAQLRKDPAITSIYTLADMEERGDGMIFEDAKNSDTPESGRQISRLFQSAFKRKSPFLTAEPGSLVQRPGYSLQKELEDQLTAENNPAPDKDAKALATEALGITDPQKWQVKPSEGLLGELGNHDLIHQNEYIGSVNTAQKRIELLPPTSEQMDLTQQRLINTNSKGLPVYFAGGAQPLSNPELRNYVQTGFDVIRDTPDPLEKEKKLSEAQLAPADIRKKVLEGQMSVQQGRKFNEAFHGLTDVNTSKPAIESAFIKHLASPVRSALWKNGDLESKAQQANAFFNAISERASLNVIPPSRSELARQRAEFIAKLDNRGLVDKGLSGLGSLTKGAIAPMAGMAVQLATAPYYAARKALGYKDAETDIIWNGGRDLVQRQLNSANLVHRMFGQGEMKDLLQTDLRKAADKIQSVDELPDDLTQKIRDAAYDGYHRFTDQNAQDVNTSRDTFDIKKDPTLRAMFEHYLKTADGSSFDGMLQMMSMTGNDRASQKQMMEYLERPRAASESSIIERGKMLDMNLDGARAGQLMAISKLIDGAKDEKQYSNLIAQAGKALKLDKPADIQMALSHLTREETDDPNSWRSQFNSGRVANPGELVTEVGSDLLVGGLTASLVGAPVGAGIKVAQTGARQALKQAFKAPLVTMKEAVTRIARSSMDSLAEKSTRLATARTMLQKVPGKYKSLGIVQPKFGAPLTAIQKGRNAAVGLGKAALAAAPVEALEEGTMAALDAAPTPQNLVDSMVMGALGGTVLVPMFAGASALTRAFGASARNQSITDYKAGLVDKFNERMSGQAGFKPMTVDDFDIMQGIQDNPAQQTALQEHAVSLGELSAAQAEHTASVMEMQDAAAGNAVADVPPSPRLLAAQAEAEASAAKLTGLSSMAFDATDELRALPETERALYTGVAKAVSGASEYTEQEAKALMGLGGDSAVAFQQAQAIPGDGVGPVQTRALVGAPTVAQTGTGHYQLPPGVRIQVPAPAIAALKQRAPSLTGLIDGSVSNAPTQNGPTARQATHTPTVATDPNAPVITDNGDGRFEASFPTPEARNSWIKANGATLTNVTTMSGGGKHTAIFRQKAPPNQTSANSGTSAPATQVAPEGQGYQAVPEGLNRRLQTNGSAGKYTTKEKELVNDLWGSASPFNTPDTFIPGKGAKGAQNLPVGEKYDANVPVAENQALAVTQAAIAAEMSARNQKAKRGLVTTSNYQAHDGGAHFNPDTNTVIINPQRLARSIWDNMPENPTRAQVAKAVALTIDEEVVHAAQMEAAHKLYDSLPDTDKGTFAEWRAEYYGAIWRDELSPEVKSAAIDAYGPILESRPEWVRAFEALRMIVQQRDKGIFTEVASRMKRHFEAVLSVLKDWYDGVMKGEKNPRVKAEIEAIEALLAELNTPKPAKAKEDVSAKKPQQSAEKEVKTPKSSTQLTLSPADAAPILAFGNSIPKAELYDSVDPEWSDGALETEPHVTVLYGLTKHEADPVAKAVAGHGPITVTLGKMSLFESEDYDVLKIDVESPELRELNDKLRKLPHESSFPDYKPHMTIAYLKKGEGQKYVGNDTFEGKQVTFDTMTFSPPSELRGELGKPELPLADTAPKVTHVMPDGYALTEDGMQTINSSPTRAYHGTPHKVDKFSMDKVGTGEGAQAYGFGLYFAGNKAVAQQYQKGLTERDFIKKVQQEFSEHDDQETALSIIHGLDLSEGQRALIDVLAKEDWWGFDYPHQAVQAAIREPENFDPSPELLAALDKFGNLYTVDLLPDEESFLDWDKPLSEQSDKVSAALTSIDPDQYSPDGADFDPSEHGQLTYQRIAEILAPKPSGNGWDSIDLTVNDRMYNGKAASERLLKEGIQGIRYADGQSRVSPLEIAAAKKTIESWRGKDADQLKYAEQHLANLEKKQREGSRNYVLFDENLVRIIAENGKPVDSLAASPSGYQSPTSMLAATAATMKGEGSRIPSKSSLFAKPKAAPVVQITPAAILDAYRSAKEGKSSEMVPIRDVFEKAKAANPNLTPEAFMQQVGAMDASGKALIGLSETVQAVESARAFVLGSAGTEMAFTPEFSRAPAIVSNLDTVKAVRPLSLYEQAAYDSAAALLAPEDASLASSPSSMFPESNRLINIDPQGATWKRISAENPGITPSSKNVVIYRSTIGSSIRPGDFVALNPDVAKSHLRNLKDRGEKGRIVQSDALLDDLLIANDATEFIFQPKEDSSIQSSPSEVPAEAIPDKAAQTREILASLPQIWQDVLQDHWQNKPVADIAKERSLKPESVAYIVDQAQGRFDYLRNQLLTKPLVRPVGNTVKAVGGNPDLAFSGRPSFAAVDQRRGTPEVVTHAEMQDAAAKMFAIDPAAAETLVTRWMDSGTTVLQTDDMPESIKAIVNEAQAQKSAMALMTAASQILATESAFNGGDSAKIARLIDLYRNTGTEQARALSMRRDPFESPAERQTWYLQNVLLTPPPSIRQQIKKNPANKEKLLEQWSKRADQIKEELKAEGIDLDATFREMAKEKKLAEATIPEAAKQPLAQAAKPVRQLVKAVLEGRTWAEARTAAGMTMDAAKAAYNSFRESINAIARNAAAAARDEMLRAGPTDTDYAAQIGLPEWTDEVDENTTAVQTAQTQALAIQRARKMASGEIDLRNPLSVNKARKAVEARKSTQFDKLSEFWRASILSGPQTGIVNVVSGLTYGTYEATFKKLSAAIQGDIARALGFKPDAPSLRDIPAMIAGVMPSLKQAGANMIRAWNTENGQFDAYALQLKDENGDLWKEGHTSALKGIVQKVMHAISFRHMGAADEFVKSFFTRIEVAPQAHQIARNEGLKGVAMASRIAELMEPGSLAWERSLAQAKRITFQSQEVAGAMLESALQPGHAAIDLPLDKLSDAIKMAKHGDFGGFWKVLSHFIFPFVETPTNIFKAGVTMSPVGGMLALVDAARSLQRHKQGNHAEAARIYNAARAMDDISNQIVSLGVILGLASLIKPGDDEDERPYMTGTIGWSSTSPGERANAYRTAPPMSIRIGDTWYSYKRLDPFASALSFTIDSIREFQSGKPFDQASAQVVVGMLKAMKEKTYLSGVSDFVNAIQDPKRFASKWATGIAIGLVPNLIRQPLRASDEYLRDTDQPNTMGSVEALARKVGYGFIPAPNGPFTPMPAIDVFGREVTKDTGTGQPASDMLLRLFSPVEIRDAGGVDPADVKLLRYNMTHEDSFGAVAPDFEIQRTIGGQPIKISLTPEEKQVLAIKVGKTFRAAIQPYIDKAGDLTEDDVSDIKSMRTKIGTMYEDAAFGEALQKQRAAATMNP